jgi:hypothetical protein
MRFSSLKAQYLSESVTEDADASSHSLRGAIANEYLKARSAEKSDKEATTRKNLA